MFCTFITHIRTKHDINLSSELNWLYAPCGCAVFLHRAISQSAEFKQTFSRYRQVSQSPQVIQ